MKKRILWALAAVNLLLAMALVWKVGGENQAVAQARRPGDYLMVPGEVTGGTTAVVYVIDTTNGLLSAIAYDDAQSRLETMPPLDLTRYFEAGMNINRRDNR